LDTLVQATLPDTLGRLNKQQAATALGFANILFEEAAERRVILDFHFS